LQQFCEVNTQIEALQKTVEAKLQETRATLD
jgi:hypothetical protein